MKCLAIGRSACTASSGGCRSLGWRGSWQNSAAWPASRRRLNSLPYSLFPAPSHRANTRCMDPPAYGTGFSSDGAHRQDPRAAPGPSSSSSPAPPLASSPAPATAPPAPLPTVSISPAPPVPAPETPPASPSRRQHAVAAAQLTPPGPAASPARHYESSDGHTAHSVSLPLPVRDNAAHLRGLQYPGFVRWGYARGSSPRPQASGLGTD